MNLNDRMEFDHVIRVHADGVVTDVTDVYAPELHDGELSDPSWSLMTGYTGQYGYNGPIMHPSEFIGGRMVRDILDTPGIYVALVNHCEDAEDEIDGWAVAYREESE